MDEELMFRTPECSLYGGCEPYEFNVISHATNCLKTRQEIEELHQKKVKRDRKIDDELLRLALADLETVREVDGIRKNGGCLGCYQERNKNDIDTTNEKPTPTEQPLTITDQESQQEETGGVNNITNSQEEIQKVKQLENNAQSNQDSTEINTNLIQPKKDNNLDKNKSQKLSLEKSNKLISIWLPITIIFIPLLVISVLYVVRRKRLNKVKK